MPEKEREWSYYILREVSLVQYDGAATVGGEVAVDLQAVCPGVAQAELVRALLQMHRPSEQWRYSIHKVPSGFAYSAEQVLRVDGHWDGKKPKDGVDKP